MAHLVEMEGIIADRDRAAFPATFSLLPAKLHWCIYIN
jgi:hypothetical protein